MDNSDHWRMDNIAHMLGKFIIHKTLIIDAPDIRFFTPIGNFNKVNVTITIDLAVIIWKNDGISISIVHQITFYQYQLISILSTIIMKRPNI